MNALQIGPMALPTMPLLLLALTGLAAWAAGRLDRGEAGRHAADALAPAAWIGVITARLAHVAWHAAAYAAHPLDVIDVRDGGWFQPAGWVAGLGWLAWRCRGLPAARQVLWRVVTPAAAAWFLATPLLEASTGEPLPPLILARSPGGEALTLREAVEGRAAVVNLWASWCGPCRQEMPMLAAAQQARRDVRFLFVNQGEDAATIATYLAGAGLTLEGVLLDRAARLGPQLGAVGLPTTLFVDAGGRVQHVHFGVLGAAALQVQLEQLTPGPAR
jgi:thiol-disulfide isomerase/thioredoxin